MHHHARLAALRCSVPISGVGCPLGAFQTRLKRGNLLALCVDELLRLQKLPTVFAVLGLDPLPRRCAGRLHSVYPRHALGSVTTRPSQHRPCAIATVNKIQQGNTYLLLMPFKTASSVCRRGVICACLSPVPTRPARPPSCPPLQEQPHNPAGSVKARAVFATFYVAASAAPRAAHPLTPLTLWRVTI